MRRACGQLEYSACSPDDLPAWRSDSRACWRRSSGTCGPLPTPPGRVLYSQSVRYFCDWLSGKGRPVTLDELTRHAISAWLAELAATREPATVAMRLRGMRRFCRWLGVEGELEIAPIDGIEIPAPPEKPVPILAQEGGRVASMCARRPDRRS